MLIPQIANPPASSQNVDDFDAVPSTLRAPGRHSSPSARAAADPGRPRWRRTPSAPCRPGGRAAAAAPAVRRRTRSRRSPARPSASRGVVARCATIGRNTSWPVAEPAVSTPLTRPRRATNHRLVMVATSAIDIDPVPTPTRTPQSITSCQASVMNTVSPLPAATRVSAIGHHPAYAEAVHQRGGERREQPEQHQVDRDRERRWCRATSRTRRCSGSISTPGTERKAAAPTRVTNVTTATTQAQCRPDRSAGGRGGVCGHDEWARTILPAAAEAGRVADSPICVRIGP